MRSILALFVIVAACGGSGAAPTTGAPHAASSSEGRATTETSSETAVVAETVETAEPVARRAPEGPPPRVTIGGEQQRDSPRVAITVVNRDASEARIAPGVRVERELEGAWSALGDVGPISLRMDCAHEAVECVALVPGAELHPPEWLGTIGDAQCACERCVPAEPGRYRFVIESCDGHRIEGEPFSITAR